MSPTALLHRAQAQGVTHLALTDHDTCAGLPEAQRAAEACGVQLINGIELSVTWAGREMHLVGLGMILQHPAFEQLVSSQLQAREARARRIGEKLLRACGVSSLYEQAVALSGQAAPGRPWFAKVLVAQGLARDEAHAFNRFLKQGAAAWVATPWVSLEQAIAALQEASGVAVLAHPLRYQLTRKKLRSLLQDFCAAGGDALEVATPGQNLNEQLLLAECLRDFPLAFSGGSDFHTPRQHWLELGRVPFLATAAPFIGEHFGLPRPLEKSA